MDVFQAIQTRREITKYLERAIDKDVLRKVEDAGYYAPTGNNLASKKLIVVRKREVLDQLAETTPYMKWMKGAQAAIIVLGNPEVSKYWLQDTSISCGFIWLEAVEVGLGSAFGAVYNAQDKAESEERETYVRNLLDIPIEWRVVAGLGLGYPAETLEAKRHVARDEVVHYEKFQS